MKRSSVSTGLPMNRAKAGRPCCATPSRHIRRNRCRMMAIGSNAASDSGPETAFLLIRMIMIGSAGPNGRGPGMMIMRKCAQNRPTCSTPRMIASGRSISI
ncbi:hypothetical protein Sala_1368 [Sphingopyxis alaskensis RB2256]|uniref:Uncharacterized protein n=1 Tax=Sphingopyxis alaskensis (strain DSM 13593 / LMG 18877 / RB2256) TaxID=317655 RepID=Q1GTE0_SPHAL|nr:hypothetical protein Sala_1368 [Sphingopyxis alaskensis RB2256]